VKDAIRIFALACVAAVLAAPAFAQAPAAAGAPPTLQGDIMKDWSGLKETMAKLASALPADKYSFKPTPAQQSFAERVVHIATINNRFLAAVGGKATAPTVDPKAAVMTKDAAIKAMNDSFDYGIALLKEQTDQTLVQPAAMPPGFMGPSTRARMFGFLIGHTWDIYGQLVVYARLNDVTPPASQRP
jgi:uncharacterized damage-inducible protein DinB